MTGEVRRIGRIAARVWTSGGLRWLVCLPAAGGSAGSFQELAGALGSAWTVVAIDPPGHGAADGPLETHVADVAEAVTDGLSRWPVPPHVLLGHSVGGMTALRVAAARRTSVTRLVLCGTPPPAAAGELRTLVDTALADADLLAALAPLGGVPELFLGTPQLARHLVPALRADLMAFDAEIAAWRAGMTCPGVSVPVLAVGATDDLIVPIQLFDRWRVSLPSARVERLAGGHFFPSDSPAPLASLIDEYEKVNTDRGASC